MLVFDAVHRNFAKTTALDGFTLAVRPGEVLGLLGPNGAGKSTAIALATGILAPSLGTVRVDGQDPRESGTRRDIGFAPQSLALYDTLSPIENILIFARLAGLSSAEARRRAEPVLEQLGLAERQRHRVATLSGGMKRRLNLAVAIIHDPQLILLDEPTANVDPQSRSAIFDIVRQMRAQSRTVVYSTHYMEEAQRLCDRVAVVDQGRVIALGTPDELIANAGVQATIEFERDGKHHRLDTHEPNAALAEILNRGDVSGLRLHQPDLESLFLQLTGRSLRS